MSPGLLVAGSIALDTLEGPYGLVRDELGGSAMYFALAASLLVPVALVAPVGADAAPRVRQALYGRPVDLDGLSLVDAPTYRWRAVHAEGGNLDLGGSDSIYDLWRPSLPRGYRGWAFIGSMRPDCQVRAARALGSASLLAADAMRSYVDARPAEARELLELCGWYFCNQDELRALGGQAGRLEAFRRRWRLDGLCLKEGARGARIKSAHGRCRVPALPGRPVVDTTGAGDSLAGGMLARWLVSGGSPSELPDALVHGVACASLAIERVGLAGIAAASPRTLAERVEEIRGRLPSVPNPPGASRAGS